MDWLGPLGLTIGVAFVSAFVPVVNIETYLVGLVTHHSGLHWWWVVAAAAAATIGQMAGKLVFYGAGREVFRLPAWLHRKTHKQRQGRFARWLQRFHDMAENRPLISALLLFVSALVGIPPYAAMALLAGIAEIKLWIFLVTGVIGRYIRFAFIASIPGFIDFWIF